MSNPSAKEQMLKLARELPEDATLEDAMDRQFLLYKIERGIQQANSGQKISQSAARSRMDQWLK
jgi:hypothetical protein